MTNEINQMRYFLKNRYFIYEKINLKIKKICFTNKMNDHEDSRFDNQY